MKDKKNIIITLLAVLLIASIGYNFFKKPSVDVDAGVKDALKTQNVVILDLNKLGEEASAYKSLSKQLEKLMSEIKDSASKKQAAFVKEEEDLKKKRSTMAKADFDKKIEEFKQRLVGAEKELNDKQKKVSQAYVDAMNKVRDEALIPILQKIAEETGVSVVLPATQVLFNANSVDITETVAKALNSRMSKATIEVK